MTAAVKFHSVPQNSSEGQSYTVTVDLRSSSSNRSYSILKRVGIGLLILVVIGVVAAVYFSINKAFKESVFSTNTTEPSVNQSSLSLYNIAQLVETKPNYYGNCNSAFQAHLEIFKICGKTLCTCIRNARDAFELHCLDYARNILKTSEECKETEFRMQRCLEITC
ncbi:MAG: hypothetical protein WBD50_07495 [Candidatus Rhabdochlamydia sp.]